MLTSNLREVLLHVAKTMSAAPQILVQLGRMRLDPVADLRDVTALLKRDAALTSRILRIANSSVYTTGEPYASLEQALARVGFGEIYRIAGFAAVAQVGSQGLKSYGITGAQLRENSLLSALVMEELAKLTGVDSEEAYTAGLLRSTGKVALEGLTLDSKEAGTYSSAMSGPLVEWEVGRAKLSNCEAAAFILSEWHFPQTLVAAIGHHYSPEGAGPSRVLAHLLNFAAGAAERLGHGLPGEAPYWQMRTGRLLSAGITEEDLEQAGRDAAERFELVRSALA